MSLTLVELEGDSAAVSAQSLVHFLCLQATHQTVALQEQQGAVISAAWLIGERSAHRIRPVERAKQNTVMGTTRTCGWSPANFARSAIPEKEAPAVNTSEAR